MKARFFVYLLMLASLTTFNSCISEDDDIFGDDNESGSLTATVNGNSFRADGPFVTAVVSEDLSNGGYSIAIGGVHVSSGSTEGIALGLIGADFSSLEAGDVFVGEQSGKMAIGGYTFDGNEEIDARAQLHPSITCTITKIDHDDQLISGTFSYDAVDDDTGETYEVRNGVFTDIEFSVTTTSGGGGTGQTGSISAEVNGESFETSGLFVIAALTSTVNWEYYYLLGGVRYINNYNDALVISLLGNDFSSLKVGDTFTGDGTERYFTAGFSAEDDDELDINATTKMVASASCTITKIDKENHLISGTFSFDAIDDDTNEVFEVRNGVFTNLYYGE